MTRDLLIVLNPREIDECMASLIELPIDKLWVSYLTELQISLLWDDQVAPLTAGYENVLIVSDDGVVRPHALEAVLRLLDEGHPVASGYCNLSAEDMRVNLSRSPLGPAPTVDAYDLPPLSELMEWPNPVYPTHFVGMSLTGMSRELWLRFPFRVSPQDGQSDFTLSKRIAEAGIPMVAAREGFCWHVKERWNLTDQEPRKRSLVGQRPHDIRLEIL